MSSVRNLLLVVLSFAFISGCASSNPDAPRSISKEERVKMLMGIASANIAEHDSTGALQVLGKIRDLDDSLPEEYYFYSLAYLQKNEMRLSIDSARRAVSLKPDYSAAKNTLGKLLLDEGKYAEAEKYLLESANDLLFRESYLPKTNLGLLYYKRGQLDKSEAWLSKAISDGGELICMAYFYRGRVESDQNQLLAAERDFAQSAKGSCAGLSDAHIAFGKTLIREKKYDLARAKFVEIQRLFPSTDASDQATQYLREIP